MKYYSITAKSKALCDEIDEDAFIVDFKDLLKKYGISSVHVNIFKHDNL